ncbi:MAG: phenylalanine-4-hydroxylase [Flavobacteriales bacterium]|nr:phenylalanine-4-hydroxylase [Flavobacteriales bacterium]
MQQIYENYTNEDFLVWQTLFGRQWHNLQAKSSRVYLDCLSRMGNVLNADRIPRFEELNQSLTAATGWSIEVVPGLIPVDAFFEFLSKKKFCSSTWVRNMSRLDYLDEPDMFHDIFGHTPMIILPEYARFMEQFGKLGVKHNGNEKIVKGLQNLYWYTIEFGLIKGHNGLECYGAGIASSFGETNHVFKELVEIKPFDIAEILLRDFVNTEIQNTYYALESFDQLYGCLDNIEQHFSNHIEP